MYLAHLEVQSHRNLAKKGVGLCQVEGQHTNALEGGLELVGVLELEGVWGDKVVTPTASFLFHVVLILVLIIMIGVTPPVLALDIIISYIEDKITLISLQLNRISNLVCTMYIICQNNGFQGKVSNVRRAQEGKIKPFDT